MLGIAGAGLCVNIAAVALLSRAPGSINARGALLHVLSDLLGSVAALVAGAVILATGWMPIDPILSLVVAALIVRSTWRLLLESFGVLMQSVPGHLDYHAIGRALSSLPHVTSVHDLHVWRLDAEEVALSAPAVARQGFTYRPRRSRSRLMWPSSMATAGSRCWPPRSTCSRSVTPSIT